MPKNPPNDFERWRDAAAAVEKTENPLKIPYDVFLKEAVDAAGFVDKYWERTADRPGLARVKKRLPRSRAEEIRSLVSATQIAQTKLLLIVDPAVVDKGERARVLISDLDSHLGFLLDDDVHEPADDQLAEVRDFHSQDGERSGPLAQKLRNYGELAATLKARLVENDDEFDPKWIDESLSLADDLVKNPVPSGVQTSPEAKEAQTTRNRLLSLLTGKVGAVRKAAAHVYRQHPAILREVTSSYERRRRAATRRAASAEQQTPQKPEAGKEPKNG